ncbi:vWA domain-containing protein [Woodsholea maritima]|uniref:vWA domain-containing protein n=1 Tax=Woodsholea maritima TaxID=240237 RepID=UPI00037CD452|nr:pilus assembly protein [Woodsholea maritima]
MLTALKKFCQNTRANVAMMFAVALAPLTIAVGGAVDYTRSTMIGLEIQNALDSGVLAASSLTQTRDPEEVVRAYVFAALEEYPDIDPSSLQVSIVSNTAVNSRRVTASASIDLPTIMLGIMGMKTMRVHREAVALEEVRNIEIALVLDVSGSMGGSRINALREAAQDFIDVVLNSETTQRTSVSIIPYNGGVRLPADVNQGFLGGALSLINNSGCPDMGVAYPTVIALPSRQVEMLEWQGTPIIGWRSNAYCPNQNAESMFLTNNATALKSRIAALGASGNTGLDVATGWGMRALDPSWRGKLGGNFSGRPADYDDPDTLKILVVMTDGEATHQTRTRWQWGWWQQYYPYHAATARSNMLDVCDQAKEEDIQVFTIAFQVPNNTARNLMRDCAQDPAHYFDVKDLDIKSAFSAIAASINALRLTS